MTERPDPKQIATVARQVVRGEAPWVALVEAGVSARRTADGWEFDASRVEPIRVEAEEVAAGIAAQADTPDGGREWASFVLATDIYSISDDQVLDALWAVSFGEPTDFR